MKKIVFLALLFGIAACQNNEIADYQIVEKIKSYQLTVSEPSGLCFFMSPDTLLTISDQTSSVFFINRQGKTLQEFSFNGNDIEGIAFDKENHVFWVSEERTRNIIKLSENGKELKRINLSATNYESNNGLEGITYCPANGHLFVINEKKPAVLYELDTLGTIVNTNTLTFATDLSGVFYENTQNRLWLVSDESEIVARCNLFGEPDEIYRTNVNKAEGICVDIANAALFLVSDSENQLYKMQLP